MKNIIYIALILLGSGIFHSCNTDDISTDTVSRVTFFPVLTMNGDALVILSKGDSYADPGATAEVAGTDVPVNVNGSFDVNTPGVYNISYSALNDDGFEAVATRTIAVIDTTPSPYDLTGLWSRSNGQPNNIIQLSGWNGRRFQSDNAGGAFPPGDNRNMVIEFYIIDGSSIFIPYQENVSPSGLNVSGLNNGDCDVCMVNNAMQLQWAVSASGAYGTFTRVFDKQ